MSRKVLFELYELAIAAEAGDRPIRRGNSRMIHPLINRLPPPVRYLAARLFHFVAITTQRTPPAHFLAAAVAIPLTVATSGWLLSFVAWLLPYLLALLSGFYVALAAISFIRQN
ncbi:MAG: hypothetical protein DCF15_17655 [Phormidesmis priestleyi]|uniref:Uncharacterized protein n=1 Tax=Phormidesmis priestleyi TaxID=268141 RepID=A0A2W4Z134_9CYAN|nr:MAG: hypothetical protein DCF15_17655 [Phormidesmis priestleyi]